MFLSLHSPAFVKKERQMRQKGREDSHHRLVRRMGVRLEGEDTPGYESIEQ